MLHFVMSSLLSMYMCNHVYILIIYIVQYCVLLVSYLSLFLLLLLLVLLFTSSSLLPRNIKNIKIIFLIIHINIYIYIYIIDFFLDEWWEGGRSLLFHTYITITKIQIYFFLFLVIGR